jgi:hypothetical protein
MVAVELLGNSSPLTVCYKLVAFRYFLQTFRYALQKDVFLFPSFEIEIVQKRKGIIQQAIPKLLPYGK